MKMMIADSEYMSRHVIMQLFSESSFEIVFVNTEEEAWQQLDSEDPPRLLILDAKMPKLDAMEICRKIRERREASPPYIILCGPQSTRTNLIAGLDAGADEFISKPLNRDELRARVRVARRWLEKEEQLSRVIQGWRVMLDTLPFGVAALGQSDEFLRVNRVFVELLGYDMKDVVGKNRLGCTLRRTADLARVRDAIRHNRQFDWVEMEVFHKDGSKRTLVVWGRPIKAGELVFQIVTATE